MITIIPPDGGDPTVANGTGWAFNSILNVMFRWVPATLFVMTNTSPYDNPNPITTPVTAPVTTTDV
ncbi:MAG: hypothetical protein JO019_03335, partial [Candidatus Kaiserbacteria bacterium]|nr:hypothetical protein [Candidatus Kaiserbacteria bacterium]